MSTLNKTAAVARSSAIRRNGNPSKHPNFQGLVSNLRRARASQYKFTMLGHRSGVTGIYIGYDFVPEGRCGCD
jgi:hypothetical protein